MHACVHCQNYSLEMLVIFNRLTLARTSRTAKQSCAHDLAELLIDQDEIWRQAGELPIASSLCSVIIKWQGIFL